MTLLLYFYDKMTFSNRMETITLFYHRLIIYYYCTLLLSQTKLDIKRLLTAMQPNNIQMKIRKICEIEPEQP